MLIRIWGFFPFNKYLLNTSSVIAADLVAKRAGELHIWKGEDDRGWREVVKPGQILWHGILLCSVGETPSPTLLILPKRLLKGTAFPYRYETYCILLKLRKSIWIRGKRYSESCFLDAELAKKMSALCQLSPSSFDSYRTQRTLEAVWDVTSYSFYKQTI